MEDQAKYIVDEVRKALDENGRFIIMELNKIFEGKSNQGIPDDENELKGVVRGYTILGALGYGTCGSVYLVMNAASPYLYAMKVIKLMDNEVTKGVARELSILYTVQHENIVRMEHVFYHKNAICMVMEHTFGVLNDFMELKALPAHPEGLLKKMLAAVAYLHNRNIIHRDLKPENILIANGKLKLADFGCAREWFLTDVNLTPQATTLYKAPELLLGSEGYTPAVDIWSVGCIYAGFYELKPLFQEDQNSGIEMESSIIHRIFQKLGTPTEESWPGVSCLPYFPQQMPLYPQPAEIIPDIGPLGNDLLWKLLCYDPTKRISAEAALEHPFLTS
ncbi:hypothetical protein DM860_003029 [Cuscuta australis]|uniref:Protein kinase domain-containing protein n=1 Tax=Cuscuta australis TaxID=267555 RepID=A0A328D1Y1_9ASTE|nr:hypothetical protein DM860_003029 [Cuscuta australis]